MACGDFPRYLDYWLEAQFADAILCPFQNVLGTQVFTLFVLGGLALGLYIRSDSVSIPLVLAILIGGVVVSSLPSVGLQVLGIAALLSITIAGYLLTNRQTRNLQ
jgi:hypothetical protein